MTHSSAPDSSHRLTITVVNRRVSNDVIPPSTTHDMVLPIRWPRPPCSSGMNMMPISPLRSRA